MSGAYQWADLVVARAGALTVAELAMVGVGAILVPFAAAIDDHQTLNARHFARGGAGARDRGARARRAVRSHAARGAVSPISSGLAAMAEAAHAQAKHAVAERIADACVAAAEVRG